MNNEKIKILNKYYVVDDLYQVSLQLSYSLKKSKSYFDYLNSFKEFFEKKKIKFKEEINKWMQILNFILLNPFIKSKEFLISCHSSQPFYLFYNIPKEKKNGFFFWYIISLEEPNSGKSLKDLLFIKLRNYYINNRELKENFERLEDFINYVFTSQGLLEYYEEISDFLLEIAKSNVFDEKLIYEALYLLQKFKNEYLKSDKEEYEKKRKKFIKKFKKIKELTKKGALPNFSIFFPLFPFVYKPELKDLFINQSWNSFFDLYFSILDDVNLLSFYSDVVISYLEGWLEFVKYFVDLDIAQLKVKEIEVVNVSRPQKIRDIRDTKKKYALLKSVEEFIYNKLLDDLGNFYNILKGEFEYWEVYDEPFLAKPLVKLKQEEFVIPYKIYDKKTGEFVELEENVVFNFNYNYHLINLTYIAYRPVIKYVKETKSDDFSILKLRDIYYKEVEHKLKIILYEKIKNDPVIVDYMNLGVVQAVSTIIQFILDKHFETIKTQILELLSYYASKIDFINFVFEKFINGFSTLNYVVGGTRTGKSLTTILFAELLSFALSNYISKERENFESTNQGDIIFSVWRHLIYNFRRLYAETKNLNHFMIDEIVGTLHKSAFMSKVQRRFATFVDTQAVRRTILWLIVPQFSSISKEIRSKGNFLLWKESRDSLRIYYLTKGYITESDRIYSPKIEKIHQKNFKFLPVLPHNFLSYNIIEADGKNKLKREISKSAEELELSF